MATNYNPNTMTCGSQSDRILDWLKKGNSIDGMTALVLFGCFRLPARIADLEKRGHTFTREWILSPGKNKKHVKYTLVS